MNELQERVVDKLKARAAGLIQKKQYDELEIILIDVSGSMHEGCENGQSKLENVKQSIMYLNTPGAYIAYGSVAFDNTGYPIQPLTTNFAEVIMGCDSLTPRGSTCFASAIQEGIKMMADKPCEKRRMILMTDGSDNVDQRWTSEMVDECVTLHIIIDTIGFGVDVNERNLMEIAKRTGGIYQHALSPLQLQEAYQKLNYAIRYLEHKPNGSTINL